MHGLAEPGAALPDVADRLVADAERTRDGASLQILFFRGGGLMREFDLEDVDGLFGRQNGPRFACLDRSQQPCFVVVDRQGMFFSSKMIIIQAKFDFVLKKREVAQLTVGFCLFFGQRQV